MRSSQVVNSFSFLFCCGNRKQLLLVMANAGCVIEVDVLFAAEDKYFGYV